MDETGDSICTQGSGSTHVGRFDERVVEVLIFRVERVVDLERAAAFGEATGYFNIAYESSCESNSAVGVNGRSILDR